MGKKIVKITDHKEAAEKLSVDVGTNNVRFFDVHTFQENYHFHNYPPAYLDKCSGVTAVISGSDNTNWMAIAPYRVDVSGSNNEKVYDLDPMIITLDSDTNIASPTAYIGYHQNFQDRTTQISGSAHLSKEDTVSTLREQYCTGSDEFTNAPGEVMAGLQHMADILRQKVKE